ncbi:hypothetical protein JW824_00165 [bacterium]|nr:hypothetical protein [bacterium]
MPNVDEIALINNLDLPIFSGGYGSTTFFPAVQLTKIFRLLNSFGNYRYFGVLINSIGLVFFYISLRLFAGPAAAFISSIVYSSHWYLLYINRIYEIATFIPFFFAVVLCFFSIWRITGKSVWIYLSVFVAGVAADCYAPPMIYAIASLLFLLIFKAKEYKLSLANLFLIIIILIITLIPFFIVQIFIGNFVRDVFSNYKLSGHDSLDVIPFNLFHSNVFLKTFTDLMTCICPDWVGWRFLVAPCLIILLIQLITIIHHRQTISEGCLFALWTYITLFMILISPIAAYIQGHFATFLILFIFLSGILTDKITGYKKIIPLSGLLFMMIFSAIWLPRIFENQYNEISWLGAYFSEQDTQSTFVSDGAFLSLSKTPFLDKSKVRQFLCDSKDNIRRAMDELSCNKPALVVATYECAVADNIKDCMVISEEMRLSNLMESHLDHGIVFYFIRPSQKPDRGQQ